MAHRGRYDLPAYPCCGLSRTYSSPISSSSSAMIWDMAILACYGQPYIHTPNIDQMAREGMRFTQAYAGSPVSAPSRATIMTGQHTGHTHVRGNKEYWRNVPMVKYGVNEDFSVVGQEPYDPQHKILPEMLKDKGYRTGVFGKWAGGYEGSASTPDKRGVDEFYGYICQFQAHLYYPNFLNRYSKCTWEIPLW